jgi:transposase
VQRDNDTDKTLAPILIDSALIPNNSIVPLQGINNQQSDDRDDLRLLYVMDKNINLPIFIKHISGNNFDISSLLNTISTLKTYHINVEDVVTDAAFSSTHNIKGLLKSNIPFITNMPNNREEYKELMGLYGTDLLKGKNAIVYNESKLCGIRVPIMINESQLYAYVMLDVDEMSESYGKAIERNINKPHSADKIDAEILDAAKFILLSSNKYEISEILPLYDTRRIIEGFYINLEKYKSLLPLGKYSDEMIRCILLIEFMTKVVQYLLDKDLKDSKYSSHSALSRLKCVWIRVYRSYEFNEATSQVEELTKEEKEIFSDLQLDLPFQTVETLKLPKKSSETTFTQPKKRGRPKGGTNKQV